MTESPPIRAQKWVALMGKRDMPTDGVEDYCTFLGRALAQREITLDLARVEWFDRGWVAALWKLWRQSADWRGAWVLIQYTGLSWSRRGFPLGVLVALGILRRRGCRCAVVFHEFTRQSSGGRRIDRMRGNCQQWVIERLHRRAEKCIFTVPLEKVEWLQPGDRKSAFVLIGANIPERLDRRDAPQAPEQPRTVIVFGVTGAPRAAGEVEEIAAVMNEVSRSFPALRLVVVGRGSIEVRKEMEAALARTGVEIVVRGVVPAEVVADEFARAHALLFVRGAITLQRGSAIAGVACGLPIVGYRVGGSGDALDQAGIEWSPWRDQPTLIRGLVRVLSDPARWVELHERSLQAQRNHFSWTRIAEQFAAALSE
ncbi:MAG TPA: glycosyltransferase [Candidatus Acidoferrales bacterium]|nr:glycosyltransferase [Candidatus Acidoferrales bacterium]